MPAGTSYWIKEGMISKKLKNVDINKDGKFDHFYFSIWNQILHAKHPLGYIRKLTLKIDGEDIEPNRIFFVLRDQWICIEQIQTISDIWWMLREEAQIYVKQKGGINPGFHNIECIMETSLLMNTRTIDRHDAWPKLTLSLQSDMSAI